MLTGGEVACWGSNYFGQATPPGGTFQQVSAGQSHTCGVTTGGAVACWGSQARGIVRTDDGGIAVAGPDTSQSVAPAPIALSSVPQLYWVDEEAQKIQRTGTDDYRVVEDQLTAAQGLNMPGSIALDLDAGKVYWTDDGAGKVRRANLDGSDVQDLVVGLDDPVGLALDLGLGTRKMYWIERTRGEIRRADLEGNGSEAVVSWLGGFEPYQIALDRSGRKMYVTIRKAHGILRLNLDNPADFSDFAFLQPSVGTSAIADPMGLALDLSRGQMYWTERHQPADKIWRANLDGSGAEDLVTSAGHSLSGIALDVVAGKMYWTDEVAGAIKRADLDGRNEQTVVTGLSAPEGIAIYDRQSTAGAERDRAALVALYNAARGSVNPGGLLQLYYTYADNFFDKDGKKLAQYEEEYDWSANGPIREWWIQKSEGTQWKHYSAFKEPFLENFGWFHADNWLTQKPLDEWYGVRTNSYGRVTELYLAGNNLRGHIPEDLIGLTDLEALTLHGNHLTGCIPRGLADRLDLSWETETGYANEILETLGSVFLGDERLIMLKYHETKESRQKYGLGVPLCAPDPDPHDRILSFDEQTTETDKEALRAVYLALSGLDSDSEQWQRFLDWLRNSQGDNLEHYPGVNTKGSGRVRELHLADGRIDEMPREFFGGTKLGGTIPYQIGNLGELRKLNLSRNQLRGSIPPELGNLRHLEVLSLNDNLLTGKLPAHLGNLESLVKLHLHSTKLRKSTLPLEFGNLHNLEEVNFGGTELHGCLPAPLLPNFMPRNMALFDLLDLTGGSLARLATKSKRVSKTFGNAPVLGETVADRVETVLGGEAGVSQQLLVKAFTEMRLGKGDSLERAEFIGGKQADAANKLLEFGKGYVELKVANADEFNSKESWIDILKDSFFLTVLGPAKIGAPVLEALGKAIDFVGGLHVKLFHSHYAATDLGNVELCFK